MSAPLAVPPKVRTAAQLLWLLAALAVVRTALILRTDDAAQDAVATVLVGVGLVAGLLSISAYLVPRGIRWARILGTLIASLAAIGGFSSVLDPSSVGYALLGAVGMAAAGGAVVLLYSAQARPFFRGRRRRRT